LAPDSPFSTEVCSSTLPVLTGGTGTITLNGTCDYCGDCYCFDLTGGFDSTYSYVDCNGVSQSISPTASTSICSSSYVRPSGDIIGTFSRRGLCSGGICPTPTPTPTPTMTPTPTSTCIGYNLTYNGAELGSSSVAYTPCCSNSTSNPRGMDIDRGFFSICSTTTPVVTNLNGGSVSVVSTGVCPCATPTPTPTPTQTKTNTPTPSVTVTPTSPCTQYTISAGGAGATVNYNGCCGNAGQTGVSIAPNQSVQKCSTTLPSLVSGSLTSLITVGSCPSCV